ncbi:hypothetical protein AB0J28_10385 [Streptosporangium canum]|uniref:hypothetical protein n=1 Tax=Streptosporangium canum TaxID=324952 RepID=UPI00342A3383
MNTAAKLGAYLAGPAVIFGGTVGVGKTVGPVSAAPVKAEAAHGGNQTAPAKTEAAHSGHQATAQAGKPAALPSETSTASPSPTKSDGHGDHDH